MTVDKARPDAYDETIFIKGRAAQMAKPFVPREKLSKKAKRELDRKKRQLWAISPVTRRSENRKRDDRKRRYRIDDDGTASFFY